MVAQQLEHYIISYHMDKLSGQGDQESITQPMKK